MLELLTAQSTVQSGPVLLKLTASTAVQQRNGESNQQMLKSGIWVFNTEQR